MQASLSRATAPTCQQTSFWRGYKPDRYTVLFLFADGLIEKTPLLLVLVSKENVSLKFHPTAQVQAIHYC